jgi:hypothetical protein
VTSQAQGVAQFLSRHVQPGERVQPLDVANGAVHAMWLVEADLATSFLYDFYFYHHTDDPFIRGLRERLLRELEESKPRFLIAATQPAFRGGPGARSQLEQWISRHYGRVYKSGGLGGARETEVSAEAGRAVRPQRPPAAMRRLRAARRRPTQRSAQGAKRFA